MKRHLNLLLLISLISYLPAISSAHVISCSHPEMCRLAQIILSENKVADIEFKNVVKIVGDPHEYEPTTTEVKDLIKAEILIAGPAELNPWIKKVNYQRSKSTQSKTLSIPLTKEELTLYPGGNHEALSHFWLYPKIFCALKSKLEAQLVSQNIMKAQGSKNICPEEAKKIEADLKATIQNIKLPLVLTHDALLTFLESVSTDSHNKVVAIKGSGHHQETSPKSVKKLYDALKEPKVIWVDELGINIPQNIVSKKRNTDLTVKIDTANSTGNSYFPVLNELNEKLKAIK